jgi:hypothetical protein
MPLSMPPPSRETGVFRGRIHVTDLSLVSHVNLTEVIENTRDRREVLLRLSSYLLRMRSR